MIGQMKVLRFHLLEFSVAAVVGVWEVGQRPGVLLFMVFRGCYIGEEEEEEEEKEEDRRCTRGGRGGE